MIAQVDLFNARGDAPTSLGAALIRQKDIIYSSRTRFNTDQAARMERHKSDLRALIARLPPDLQDDPEVLRLKASCRQGHIDIVHLIYRQNQFELESKDYEFSRATVEIHWQAGKDDMATTTAHPDWLTKSEGEGGITIYDLAHDRQRITQTSPGGNPS
jgi:NTE family protein